MKIVWQISYPLKNVRVKVVINADLLDKRLVFRPSAQAILGQNFFQPILFCQSGENWGQNSLQTVRQILWLPIRGCVDFFLQLNLLPPYLLCSQGDNCCSNLIWDMKVCLKAALLWVNKLNLGLVFYGLFWSKLSTLELL